MGGSAASTSPRVLLGFFTGPESRSPPSSALQSLSQSSGPRHNTGRSLLSHLIRTASDVSEDSVADALADAGEHDVDHDTRADESEKLDNGPLLLNKTGPIDVPTTW